MTASVLTANALRGGDVVYLRADGRWSIWLAESAVAHDKDAEARLLAEGERGVAALEVVGPYLMKVEAADGAIRPLGQREIIRAKGPSIRLDLGKQAIGS
jgi:sulfite reductase (NADPH) hemoprotein beta-component